MSEPGDKPLRHLSAGSLLTGGEYLTVIAVSALAGTIVCSYLADRLGLGTRPLASAGTGVVIAIAVAAAFFRETKWQLADTAGLVVVTAGVLTLLVRFAAPSLLPRGSGTDLTHHLILIDFIERNGHLPHDTRAVAYLGEMADYTPGLHLLAVAAAALARTDGFHALYPTVAVAAALKFAVFFLIVRRVLASSPVRTPVALAGVLCALLSSAYSLGSFMADSFLAQAVSELFALAGLWALVLWDQRPDARAALLFALGGVGAFLTWPVWIGPLVLSFGALILMRRDVAWPARIVHAGLAFSPIAAIALLHAAGRAGGVAIVGTSGAVTPLSATLHQPWLLAMAAIGTIAAFRQRRARVPLVFAAALALQTAGLWLVARMSGAATPYMALKMTYLAIYPAIAFAAVAAASGAGWLASRSPRTKPIPSAAAWLAVAALGVGAGRDLRGLARVVPIVNDDLFSAARWTREHVPVGCVDYLVGNNYTAYWLHLAGLGNPRISPRTADDDTFDSQASMGRWLVPSGIRYAIADTTLLPMEIRNDVDVLATFGRAEVIQRRGPSSCPGE